MSLKETKKLYHKLVKQGVINKDIQMKELPKLKQDIVKSVTQTSLNKKYGDLIENIIERKLSEKK